MTDATKLAESLRNMRGSARSHHHGLGAGPRWSVVLDDEWRGDLSDAADLLLAQAAELAEWRSVFGHLGATPDECGNVLVEARKEVP